LVPRAVHDTYYLTVGAARIWPVLHGLIADLSADSLADDAWEQFLTVNRSVARTVACLAPECSRVTVHDYTLLMAVPDIRRLRPDVSLVYVHHTSWPQFSQVHDSMARKLLQQLAGAMVSADAVVLSAQQWRTNLETWDPTTPLVVVTPGIDRTELEQQALAAESGYWANTLRDYARRPVVAAVGRADPAKNFDSMLTAWAGLVRDGLPGTLCLHLTPTTRSALPAYRTFAETLSRLAAEANSHRPGAVIVFERQSQSEALWLLQNADVVVVCSHADGWNLVATEACVLGSDPQRLVLSSQVGATDLLKPIAHLVQDPSSDAEIAYAIRAAIENRPSGRVRRTQLEFPRPEDWWNGIVKLHHRFGKCAGDRDVQGFATS
jgi:trehalose-6-phosphate synthase